MQTAASTPPPAPDAGPAAAQPEAIPRRTTPTWEMELLLSGATVFGLLSLPRAVDELAYRLFLRGGDESVTLLYPLWVYAKVALLTVIGTFVVHLVLRGYWVALVGLSSVYPEGIRWDRLRIGPLQRRAAQDRIGSIAARIDAADDRATRVFGVGFGLALVMVVPMVLVSAIYAVSLAVHALGGPRPGSLALLAVLPALVLPLGLIVLVDRRFGGHVRPDGGLGRAMRRVFLAYDRIGFGRTSNPLLAIFQSNEGALRSGVLIFAVFLAAIGITLGQLLSDVGELEYGDFAGLPADGPYQADSALAAHYATQRGEVRSPAPLPFIQDRVIRGPYVELFVPYRPRRFAPALRAACPEAIALAEAGGPARASLDCIARLLDVRVDGAPVAVRLDAAEDPVTGGRGVLAMIPVAELSAGRHELAVLPPPRERPGKDDPPPRPYRIPFWR